MTSDAPPTILLAEDNPDDVFFFRRALKNIGVKNPLKLVTDGEQAIDYFLGKGVYADRQQHPLPALAILDIKMPKYSGLEVCREIRNDPSLKQLPVVILSTSPEQRDMETAQALGIQQYMVKPSNPAQLESELREMFERWLTQKSG